MKTDDTKTPRYRVLGESGLIVDEDGNEVSPSEIYDDDEPETPATSSKAFESFRQSSFVSALDDKSNPAHWFYYYDERYCGPDRQAWMEKMALKHRQEKAAAPAKSTKESSPAITKPTKESATPVAKPKREIVPPIAEPAKENVKAVSTEAKQKACGPALHTDFLLQYYIVDITPRLYQS